MDIGSPVKEAVILSHTSTEVLAEKVANISKNESNDMKIVFRKDVIWKTFPDGYPNLFVEEIQNCSGKNVVFLGSFHSPQIVFEQISLIYVLPRYSIRSLTFVLPYFPTGTMERIDTEGQIATASTMARILSSIPLSAMGPARIVIFDIHALQERFFFTDNVVPHLVSAVPYFLKELDKLKSKGDVTIAFPDEGAYKRFHQYFKGFPIIRCIKRRGSCNEQEVMEREITIVDGDPKGQHVVIVDDLIMTGATMLKCAEKMLNEGAKEVSAYVTHAVFPKESWRSFLSDNLEDANKNMKTFWITDSIPHAQEISKHAPFKLLSLSESIHDVLQNVVQC